MAVLAAFIAIVCNDKKPQSLPETEKILEKRIDSLLSVMTLEEKIGQMSPG